MLDPIPTSLTKQCLHDFVSLITFIVNASLSTGIVPPHFKQAIVIPLLKKPGLDTNDMKKFRPVSNLSFITKILEKVVLNQLKNHLSGNNLLEIFQSVYRQNHSTETAVLSILDGLLGSANERLVSLVALLDLSAAFDTLDHPILLKRLETTFVLGVQSSTGLSPTRVAVFSQSLLMVLCPPPALLCTACPRVSCSWDLSCLPCTLSLCQM